MFDVEDILEAFNRWKFRDTLPDDAHKKVSTRFDWIWVSYFC